MLTYLVRHNDEYRLIIDESLLKEIGATAETPFDVTCDGHALMITPIRGQVDQEPGQATQAQHR
ncbi:MAG: hypothetical protein IT442_04095 [Phycisphaeraceae bacterium]|nr:hypothetical protein [Phycisphaeraceae bacterium]